MFTRKALIHSRIKEFLSSCIVTGKTENFLQIVRSALNESQDKLRLAHNSLEEDEGLNEIVGLVYEPTGTDMGDYWISFLEMTSFLIQDIHACHVGNLSKCLSSTYKTLKYLISYHNNNCGRWLPNYWASISSLPDQRHKFFAENFTQYITGLPYSYQGMDF